MLKDHFQRSTQALNNLRSQHFKVSEYLNKGRYRLKQKFFGKGKKHYDFDLNSQQFFHQYVDDIIFEPTDIQQIFYNEINKSLESPLFFNNKKKVKDIRIAARKNPSQVRAMLARHYRNRCSDLSYKKYRTLLRSHNLSQEQHLTPIRSRTNLLDREIQQCLSRQTRLQIQDYFEQSYTQGGKPVPVNENNQPIYKYLDEEDCWFSNIARDDIQAYLRNTLFRESVLEESYWGYWYQWKYLVFSHGLEFANNVEQEIVTYFDQVKKEIMSMAKLMIFKLERGLQQISPGNLIQKQNLTNFIYGITGLLSQTPVSLPLIPSTQPQLTQNYNKIIPLFFKSLVLTGHRSIIDMLPKLNSFCSIMFKYQNQQILEGEKQIRLGLEDQIDIKKQLITMLEEQWVQQFVNLDFRRFEYKLVLKQVDWEHNAYAKKLEQERKRKLQYNYPNDYSLEQLIKTVRLTTYQDFRKILKKRSQKLLQRVPQKYEHMQLAQKINKLPDTGLTKQKITEFYKSTSTQFIQPLPLLKESTRKYFNLIMKDNYIKNPVEIQINQMLACVKVRESRTRIMGLLNGMRCYERSVEYDLRVLCGCEFVYEVDDDFLINSNKQTVQKFQKNMKDNETSLSKPNSHQGLPTLDSQSFLQKSSHTMPSLYKKDTPTLQYFNNEIPHILVKDGIKKKPILYNIVLEDLKHVQARILQIGTHFINKYERYIKMRELPELVHRVGVLEELYQLEEGLIWQKYLLIQEYYYIFENTVETVLAHKIAKIIIQLLYEQPKIDLQSDSYHCSYSSLTQLTKSHRILLHTLSQTLHSTQSQQNKTFHKKFAQSCQIPLTLWAYIYCDMQVKGAKTYNKLQRMNSVSSKMSQHSKSEKERNVVNQLREQIREEFGEDSQEAGGGEEREEFNLETYDQYMLKRNMDDIFEDIVSGGQVPKDKGDKDVLGVSSLGLENLTVNPRFQGGPHALHNYLPDYKITSGYSQKLLNFSQNICYATNIYTLVKQLVEQAKTAYGYCSTEYMIRYQLQIVKRMQKILQSPLQKRDKFYEIQSDDLYHELVTQDMKHFQQTMTPILDLPSLLQLSIPATHEKHQNTLPSIEVLSKFDYNILVNLIKLQKPINSAVYRQLNLGINLIEFFRLRELISKIQLEREQIFNGYKVLGAYCDIPVEKYTHCYGRTGGSQIFVACSQAKIYNNSYLKHPTFNDSIEQLRSYYELQQTQLQLFKQCVLLSKKQIQPYIRISWNIDKVMNNCLVKRNDLLLSEDRKNVKMVCNRVKGYVSTIGGQIYKTKSYLKYKLKLKNQLEDKIRKHTQSTELQPWINKYYLTQPNRKYNPNCTAILSDKLKKILTQRLTQQYTKDLAQNISNISTMNQLMLTIHKIRNYANSLPYLSKILILPTEYQSLIKKAFYDQKKVKIVETDPHAHENIWYVCSQQQVLQQWLITHKSSNTNLQKPFQLQQYIKSLAPPKQKQQLFKWLFKIPTNKITATQKSSLKHLLNLYSAYTGKSSISEYRVIPFTEGSRNKYTEMLEKYTILLEYIQANLIVICLQTDGNVVQQIMWGIQKGINFQEMYPLEDEQIAYPPSSTKSQPKGQQTMASKGQQGIGASSITEPQIQRMFLSEDRTPEFTKSLHSRIDSRRYRPELQYFAVGDQILQFLKSKIEGHGVIRHCMRELRDQMMLFGKVKYDVGVAYMKSKSYNIMCMLWLGLWRMIKTKKDNSWGLYITQFLDVVVDVPHLEIMQAAKDKNSRRGISKSIPESLQQLQQQKQRYNQGVYSLKSDFLVNKLRTIYNFLPFNLQSQMQQYVHSSQSTKGSPQLYKYEHNFSQIEQFKSILLAPGSQFRYEWFAKMREFYAMGNDYIETKVENPTTLQLLELEEKKIPYFQYLVQGKIYMTALTVLKIVKFVKQFPENMEKFWPMFYESMQNNRQIVDINAFNIYDQLQAYKNSGKIIFSKTQQTLCLNSSKTPESQQNTNKIYRVVIFNKLLFQQFKNQLLQIATNLLKAEKTPKSQGKKIQNTSLIPRVHLISSYSSPLIVDRKTYISQQYKLAFVQAFINRFRNKVSRVDLLSSGYGFVITVPDLEDCVNYMNKLLFTFSEKEFKVRLDTFSQYYEILIDGIRSRNQIISQQKSIIKHLQDKVKNTLQAEYLSKVSKLLQQKVLIQQKLALAEQNSNGLQHRVRKAVQYEYDKKILSLEKQNEELRGKFDQFKELFIRLTKDSTKNNFLNLVNMLKDQTANLLDKKIDLSESFKAISQSQPKQNIKPMVVRQQQESVKKQVKQGAVKEYEQQDIQKCKIGQSIVHDPYYITKLINKMRIFNLFKLGAKKLKHQAVHDKRTEQLVSLHKIQDRVIVQSQRETVLRDQLIKAQEELSRKSVELQRSRHVIEGLENQKAKLKILLVTKEKKIQQKQRQNQQFKKKIQEKSQAPKIDSKQSIDALQKSKIQQQLPRISAVRQSKKPSNRKIPRQPFITTLQQKSGALSLYEKFQLSNKDSTWRQKCEQLYLENKKLLNELEKIKSGVTSAATSGIATPITREGHSLNMRNKRTAEESERDTSRSEKRKFTNLSFKYGVMKG